MIIASGTLVTLSAQNATAHALLQTAESLSLDAYSITKLDGETLPDSARPTGNHLSNMILRIFNNSYEDSGFASDGAWLSGDLESAARKKFAAYLGKGEAGADKLLKEMKVRGGLAGLDFSKSTIEDGCLHVRLTYKASFALQIWGLSDIEINQAAVCRLLMKDAPSSVASP
jgi:hypothetical protein